MKKRVNARFLFLQGKLPTIEKKNKHLGFAAYKLLGKGSLPQAHRATSARPPPPTLPPSGPSRSRAALNFCRRVRVEKMGFSGYTPPYGSL